MANSELDLESVRQDYLASLQDLTFNSKPIITNLTIIAQENINAARSIVQAIEEQIRTCQPQHKLPVLYLLDSISKNVGGTYIMLFSRNLYHTFMDTYNAVDQATKHKLERVLATWKSGPTGNPVYSLEVTGPIEKNLLKQQVRYQPRGSIDGGRTHIHINPNFLSGINQSGLTSYQQTQQPTTQQVPQVPQPIQQTSNVWVDAARYNNNVTTAFPPAATLPRQGFYNTPQFANKPASPIIQQNQVFVPPPEQQGLLQECQALILQRQQYASRNPSDLQNQNQIGNLRQLSEVLQKAPLTVDQIQQVRQLFASFNQMPNPATLQAHGPPIIPPSFHNLTQGLGPSISITGTTDLNVLSTVLGVVYASSASSFNNSGSLLTQPQPGSIPVRSPVQQPPSSIPQPPHNLLADPNTLVKNLINYGLHNIGSNNLGNISGLNYAGRNNTPTPPPPSSINADPPSSTVKSVMDLERIRLTSNDIQRKHEGAIAVIYDALPRQCKQCGFRYAGDEEGKAKMDAHLDWHFRQNRRMKEKSKKAQSRSWFVNDEDWIHSRESDTKNTTTPAFFDFDNSGTIKNVTGSGSVNIQTFRREELINESTVIVPLDPEKAGKPCPICQEKLQSFWNDTDEEWLFRNAVEVDGIIYHATCHADALKHQGHAKLSENESVSSPPILGKRKASPEHISDMPKRPALVS
ncbi:6250_t:CDS:2 [Funneliformis geosporum]|uniref:4620_t:CDS:1 n=1 Tax=Funneliformis geosporum TaxID=1117311 RepID=A0A9W4SRL6_9GLOM|nr:6250_t:CDS:2 [Funneliformis geosporum]CAI2179054.1 4620_t:CDS:2 [Funneliformis geosporum]